MSSKLSDDCEQHESYGLLQWDRQNTSTGQVMFGSKTKTTNPINLKLHRAEYCRDLNHDWTFARECLFEVEMSPTQFAEFLTTPNYSSGIPCTIRYVCGKKMARPEFTPDTEKFQKEYLEDMQGLVVLLAEVRTMAKTMAEAPGAIRKGDFNHLKSLMDEVAQELSDNLPFVYESFVKAMQKTVQEAKADVEAFVQHRITETGLKVLKDQAPKLLEGQNPVNVTDEKES